MRSALVLLAATTAALAQAPRITPARAVSEAGTSSNYELFPYSFQGPNQGRFQTLIDVSEIGGAAFTSSQLEFRPASLAAYPIGGGPTSPGVVQIDIDMSMSPVVHDQAQATFANNHGSNVVRVFSGQVTLAAVTPGTWPMPWQPPIVFQTPFTYDPALGASLVIEVTTHSNTATGTWRAEEYRVTGGRVGLHHAQSGCVHSGGVRLNAWSAQTNNLLPGGTLSLLFSDYPNEPSLAINSVLLGVSGVGSPFGGSTLPVDLTGIGLPAYANCDLAVAPITGVVMAFQSGASAPNSSYLRLQPALSIPNNLALVGTRLFAQNVAVDQPSGMALRVVASPALEVEIGNPAAPLASQVVRGGSTTSPTGAVRLGRAMAFRLQ